MEAHVPDRRHIRLLLRARSGSPTGRTPTRTGWSSRGAAPARPVRGEGLLSFSEADDGTEVALSGDVYVTGIVARVGQRLLGSTSKMMMDQFFACIQEQLNAAG